MSKVPKVKRKRSVPVSIMATEAERAQWELKAKKSAMLLSHWIRAALDAAPAFDVTLTPKTPG